MIREKQEIKHKGQTLVLPLPYHVFAKLSEM